MASTGLPMLWYDGDRAIHAIHATRTGGHRALEMGGSRGGVGFGNGWDSNIVSKLVGRVPATVTGFFFRAGRVLAVCWVVVVILYSRTQLWPALRTTPYRTNTICRRPRNLVMKGPHARPHQMYHAGW